ncbi:hypothetical protein FIV42_22820 [Persicimonas caeni]|uniref:DUF5683 domain-containing protein n=1 Tax=Persicimonas caeni TaxID=2292766 RepID=A0A4Y6PYS0_PERCE|nr:hypothetical protein [Persicimonas caeni]QDG53472.1 hypothetical protein FIV42_22820 [Persicimonas caeni]QED34693.1 hypothetical protein FRD00_22815 [Persicimonas caeni]
MADSEQPRKLVKEAAPLWKRLLITFFTAILSGLVPGLGQLINRHWIKGVVMGVLGLLLFTSMLGFLVRFFAYVDAASWAWQRTGAQYE